MKTDDQLISQAGEMMRRAGLNEPSQGSWGVFMQQTASPGETVRGFFIWHDSREELLEGLPFFCIYWTEEADAALPPKQIKLEARAHIQQYQKGKTALADMLFRVNDLLFPGGIEISWLGSFDQLVFSPDEIPRRTRIFCRQTLADMQEPGINAFDDSPIEPGYINVFTECLGDFGLEGQGLDMPLPYGEV